MKTWRTSPAFVHAASTGAYFSAAARGLEPAEHGGQVGAQNIREISALLHQHSRQADPRDCLADAAEFVLDEAVVKTRVMSNENTVRKQRPHPVGKLGKSRRIGDHFV